jgi:uncharacterized protein DUF551
VRHSFPGTRAGRARPVVVVESCAGDNQRVTVGSWDRYERMSPLPPVETGWRTDIEPGVSCEPAGLKWTAVSERLPDLDLVCLVYLANGESHVGHLTWWPGDDRGGAAGHVWESSWGDGCALNETSNPITHWMELPAGPKP